MSQLISTTSFFGSSTASLTVIAVVAATSVAGGCAHIDEDDEPETAIVVPSAATSSPQYQGDGSIPDNRPVVRMSDGYRDWEIEIPETQRGYQVRVPLDDERQVRADHHSLTRADQELLDHLRQTDPDYEREGYYDEEGEHIVDRQARREGADLEDRDGPEDRREADPAPTRPSYFQGLDNVQRHFEAGHYEQAMVHLADLEEAYPNDDRIKSMKGTLWMELGFEGLARENWEQAVQINENNQQVREALRRLDDEPPESDVDEDEQLEQLEENL